MAFELQRARDGLRSGAARWLERPASAALLRVGLGPGAATVTGVALAAVAAYFAAAGAFLLAGALVFAGAAFDMVDGALARRAGLVSKRGALMDSVFDRVSEAAVLFGLLFYYTAPDTGQRVYAILVFPALTGSLMVSYVRARAEGLGLKGGAGFLTRPERVVITGAGLLAGAPWVVLWILAIGAPLSAAHRFWAVWRAARAA